MTTATTTGKTHELVRRQLNDDGLLVRTAQIRAADDDAMTFSGIGVPYNEVIEHWFGREQFAPGSVDSEDALILYGHYDPIGRLESGEDTEAGYRVNARLSDTTRGRDVHTLMKDGVLTKMSIGFEPIEYSVSEDDEGELITWTKVRAREFSVVPFPAYDSAAVETVRHRHTKETPMPTETLTRAELDAALEGQQSKFEDLERSMKRIEANTTPAGPAAGSQFRSMGHFLHALATGDEKAAEFHRAYAGGTEADDLVKETPVGEFIKWVEARMTTINMFSRGTLPATGNTVDFVRMPPGEQDKALIGTQAAEGDNLVGPFKIALEDDSAKIETWGGWTELSKQRIERSQHNYLDKVLRVMGIGWARHAEARFKAFLAAQLAGRTADGLPIGAAADYTEYLGAIVDAGDYYAANGYALDGLALSPDKFKALALVEAADGRPLMSVYGTGTNTTGVLNLPKGQGNLAGVPVDVVWDTTGHQFFYDSAALQIDMSPGAPAQLQDENIINLTKQFSLYGYAALYDPFPGGLLPLVETAPAG